MRDQHRSPLISPAVVFSNLGMTGPEGALQEDTMVPSGTSWPPRPRLRLKASAWPTRGSNVFDRPATKARLSPVITTRTRLEAAPEPLR